MRYVLIALAACGVLVSAAAEAQYYPPQGYYDGPPPPRYYRRAPPGYYGPPGYYRGETYSKYGPDAHYAPLGAPARSPMMPGDHGQNPWQPRLDPRNGGLYCLQAGFTVQDGVCKPGRY